jgi:hypothetical protein
MKNWNRMILFLLLNVLVSACTTLTVLVLWDRAHDTLIGDTLAAITGGRTEPTAQVTATLSDTPMPAATPTPSILLHEVQVGDTFASIAGTYRVTIDELLDENGYTQVVPLSAGDLVRVPVRVVEIVSVVGVGDHDLEHVVIRNLAEGEVHLSGWTLEDGEGHSYTFPQVTIHIKEGTVNVYTKRGASTVLDLFWGLEGAIWQSGSVVRLRDSAGTERATYTVP